MKTCIRYRFILLFFFSAIVPVPLAAQTLHFKELATKDGLPSMVTYNIFQDHQGYIWVSTMLGIVKHDGQRFVPSCTNVPVWEQGIYAFDEGPDKKIYYGSSSSRIFRIDGDSTIHLKDIDIYPLQAPSTGTILQLSVKPNRNILFSTFSNTFEYNHKTGHLSKISQNDTTRPHEIEFKKMGHTYLTIRHHFDNNRSKHDHSIIRIPEEHITFKVPPLNVFGRIQLHQVGNKFYFIDGTTVYKLNGNAIQVEKKINGFLNAAISPDKKLWIMGTKGILVLDQNLDSVATYLENKTISSVCFDRDGGIWVSSLGQGVFYCRDLNEKKYHDPLIEKTELSTITPTRSGLLFFTSGGDLCRLDNEKFEKLYSFKNHLFVTGLIERDHDFIIGSKQGLFMLDKNNLSIQEIKEETGRSIYARSITLLAPDTLFCTSGTSFLLIQTKSKKIIRRTVFKDNAYFTLPYDRQNMFFSNIYGLWNYQWKKDLVTVVDTSSFPDMGLIVGAFDQNKNLWLDTQLGGFFIRQPNGKVIELKNCPFVMLSDIVFYRNNVFVSTNMGVFKSSLSKTAFPKNWIRISDQQAYSILITGETLWIASSEGLLSLDLKESIEPKNHSIILSSAWAKDKKIDPLQTELNYDENDLRFNFDFLNYKWPVSGFYFSLDGPTSISGHITGNALQVQNLSPGQYTLKVYPFKGNSYDPEHFLVKNFIIHPAFWQTWWFRLMIILCMILATALLVALYYNRKRKREKQTAEVNKLLAEHTLTALKAQINPHFISNSLSAIQALIDDGQVDKANQYIARFSLLIRYVLKYSDKSLTRLIDELKIIELNIELEQLRFTDSFTFTKQIDQDLDLEELHIPPLITQPFIENAIWHGLLPMKNQRPPEIILKISRQHTDLVISIIDNGVGRNYAHENAISNNPYKESKGTALIQKRIENLNQLYQDMEAKLEIVDLLNGHESIGTQVNIILPVNMLIYTEEQ